MTKRIIILMGAPGSGKGTQGTMLSQELGIPHISTGDIFRQMIDAKTEESETLNSYISKGKLVPSDLVNKIVMNYIKSERCSEGCILDGHPRKIDQAEYLFNNIDCDIKAVFFDVADKIIIERILNRVTCTSCKSIFNTHLDSVLEGSECLKCRVGLLSSRSDDNEEALKLRLKEYKDHTLPLIKYFEEKNTLITVNGAQDKSVIMNKLTELIKNV